jgi:hypothetical protein
LMPTPNPARPPQRVQSIKLKPTPNPTRPPSPCLPWGHPLAETCAGWFLPTSPEAAASLVGQ